MQNGIIAVIKPDNVDLKLLELFAEGIWKSLEVRARQAKEIYEQSLKGNFGRSSEDQNSKRNADSEGQAH
jgi:hypothetical protein